MNLPIFKRKNNFLGNFDDATPEISLFGFFHSFIFIPETTLGSVSEKTLHSLNLSCNGKAASPQENLSNGSNETLQKQQPQQQLQTQEQAPIVQIECINGEKSNVECEQQQQQQLTAAKKPSYLGLACSISGYSGITRYDSKLREGFRSRDSSPGSRLITRETSPAGFR